MGRRNKNSEIYLGGGSNLEVKNTKIVSTIQTLSIFTPDGVSHNLDVKIETDFSKVPEEYHEVFFNVFSSRYLNKVSFKDNPFLNNGVTDDIKWYQFWKKLI